MYNFKPFGKEDKRIVLYIYIYIYIMNKIRCNTLSSSIKIQCVVELYLILLGKDNIICVV